MVVDLAGVDEIKKVLLCVLIFYDFSLHLVELLKIESLHPLFPIFPSRETYTLFWTLYWGFAFILSLKLLKDK